MALEGSFRELSLRLEALRDGFVEFRTTALDKPVEGDVVLVDLLGDAADDLLGWVEEAMEACAQARQALAYPTDLDRARRALITCQKKFNLAVYRFSSDLLVYERMAELTSLGEERKGEWLVWANNVKGALELSRQPFYESNEALFLCWQELAERIGVGSVSVQATNIGQQIKVPSAAEAAREGVT
ncbi:MAG TPA: hypothetical protein VJQ56_07375 [Blastocatellia bacterium]|nr:hypothetical protein [Blastocatellia bacterium]